MTKFRQKLIIFFIIGVMSICFCAVAVGGATSNVAMSPMADPLTYVVKNVPTNANGVVGETFSLDLSGATVEASDGSEYTVNAITLENGDVLPSGLSLVGKDIAGTPTAQATVVVTLGYEFTNDLGTADKVTSQLQLNITTLSYRINNAPPSAQNRVGEYLEIDLSLAEIVDDYSRTYAVTSIAVDALSALPTGLSIGNNTISGTPTQQENIDTKLVFTYTDKDNNTATLEHTISFEILPALIYSLQDAINQAQGYVDSPLNLDLSTIKVIDQYGAEYAITSIAVDALSALPTGLSIGNNTISGTPTQQENIDTKLVFTYTDKENNTATLEHTISFEILPSLIYSLQDAINQAQGYVDSSLNLDLSTIKVIDQYGAEYAVTSIAVDALSALPTGLSFGNNTISGTPTQQENIDTKLVFTYTDKDNNTATLEHTISFEILPALIYSLQGVTKQIKGSVGDSVNVDMSQVKIVDQNGGEYVVSSIIIDNSTTLPAGLSFNGNVIEGEMQDITAGHITKFVFKFTNAIGQQAQLTADVNIIVEKLANNVVFSNIPNAFFIYDISNPVYLSSVIAKLDQIQLVIKEIYCIGALPSGLKFANNTLDGKAKALQELTAIKFKAVFQNGEYAIFDVPLKVERQNLGNMTIDSQTFVYNRYNQFPNMVVRDLAGDIIDASNYDILFYRTINGVRTETSDLKNVGKVDIEAVGKGNYKGVTNTQSFMINQLVADDSFVEDFGDVTYNRNKHQKAPIFNNYTETNYTVQYFRNGVLCVDESDYINVGEITVEIFFSGNYAGKIIKSYQILQAEASINDITFMADIEFDGKGHIPTPIVDQKWLLGVDYDVIMTFNGQEPKDYISVGEYLVTVKFKNNVSGKFEQIFIISPQTININLSGTVNFVYDGQEKLPTTYILGDYKKDKDYTINCYRNDIKTTDFTSVGKITVVFEMINNYRGSASDSYFIYPKSMPIVNDSGLDITIISNEHFFINDGFVLTKLEDVSYKIRYGANESLKLAINIGMTRDGENADLTSLSTVKIKTDMLSKDIKNIRIEYIERGIQISKSAAIDSNGYIVFDIYSVGEIAIIVEYPSEDAIPSFVYWAIGGGALLLIILIIFTIYIISKKTGVRTILPNRRK